MYEAISNPFKIANLFPPDVSPAGRFVLCLLHLSSPISNTALRMVLKPLVCDDNVPSTIQALLDGGYLYERDTDQGRFFALSARTSAYIDYRNETTHRRQQIGDKNLITYRLASGILAEKLVSIAAKLYVQAWDKLTAEQRTAYLTEKYEQYKLQSTIGFATFEAAFTKEIQRANVRTIDLLPRSLVTQESVIEAMADSVQAGKIPCTEHFNKARYTNSSDKFLKLLQSYDAAQSYKLSLAAKRQVAKLKMDTDPQAAKDYLKLHHEMGKAAQSIKELTAATELLTYRHQKRVLSLHILAQNGIFMRGYKDGMLYFALLNNAADGLKPHILDMRLDYIVTLADKLGKTASVMLYSLPADAQKTVKRLAALHTSSNPASTFTMPSMSYHNIPVAVKPKFEVWHNFVSFLSE